MKPRREREPHDRLTRIADAMLETLHKHPENPQDVLRAIIFVNEGPGLRGCSALTGYDDDIDAMVDVFVHMRNVFRANGRDLLLTTLGEG